MDRQITRRTVSKLAYAAPLVAATIRLSARPVGAIASCPVDACPPCFRCEDAFGCVPIPGCVP